MSTDYYVNNPVFVKERKRFDGTRLKRVPYVKSVFINERIVEIPFALVDGQACPGGSFVSPEDTKSLIALRKSSNSVQIKKGRRLFL